MDCRKCKYAEWGWDDAWGAYIKYVEGCSLGYCPYEEEDEDDG